jgi:glycerophosphoryl diester phosphodiesterase
MAIKIVGHRGAAGLALENSRESIEAALSMPIDALEFDIRRTRDSKIVVIHNATTERIAEHKLTINDSTLAELQALRLRNGQHISTLEETLRLIGGKMPVVIDIKDNGVAEELLHIVARFPKTHIMFTGRKYTELAAIHRARPDIPFLVQHHFDPLEIIHTAKSMGATGISLNMWLTNPLTYRLAKKAGLDVYVYTINHGWLVRFFRLFYPDVAIFTNFPGRFAELRERKSAT